MGILARKERLTDAELNRLEEFLATCNDGEAMNLEEVDGFFAALIAGPEVVMPSEYLPEVWGGEGAEPEFANLEEANEILGLLMRHWNEIADTLADDEVYLPLLLVDEGGVAHGNDWARGLCLGTHFDHEPWVELVEDEERGGCMIPMLLLFHEHDEDPEMRPEPIGPKRREEVFALMAAGLLGTYRHFREADEPEPAEPPYEPERAKPKIGRNEPCPCGSGKKYKRCCGGATVN